MRPFPIADQSDGINLLRSKGGASPKGLFDLQNGWVTQKKTINARPGCGDPYAVAPTGTKGGVGFENKIHTFASSVVANSDPLVVVNVLKHPTGGAAALSTIHRAFPVLGRLYVVAEFADGVVQHYWLQRQTAWAPSTIYQFGKVVSPPADNGFVYEITNASVLLPWAADTEYALNAEVLPTVANGFKYKATTVVGSPARSGTVEPTWPTTESATVLEYRSG